MFRLKLKLVAVTTIFMLTTVVGNLAFPARTSAARNIVFPVIGQSSFVNDFYYRRGTRQHNAIDVMAKKGQMLVSAVEGTIVDVQYPQPSWGYSITVEDDDGYQYSYLHMNDDMPGTNNGRGGGMNAYAADMREGNRVARGQLIGWVGDSGNSNGVPHLHFEMYLPNGTTANPYNTLVQARRISKPAIPGRVTQEILPYGNAFSGGSNISMGNFDADPVFETVVAAGKGGGPHIKTYQPNGALGASFFAYDPAFRSGVDVATGDIDGDGIDEIITVPDKGGGPHVKIFNVNGSLVGSFFAFEPDVRNGYKIAAGDLDGDAQDEIVVGLGAGADSRVRAFDLSSGTPTLLYEFMAFSDFRGGVDVSVGDISQLTPHDEIVTAAGPGGGPHVKIFQADGTYISGFYAYNIEHRGGVRVSVGNVATGTPQEEILTLPASAGNPHIKAFSANASVVTSALFIERWWIGGYDIGAGYGTSVAVTGTNRRVSIRQGIH